ncbi:SMP-30/gluconolactonase/LRE family protein [Mycobacterium interjectum]|uniref:SMP-30/gluconolactonase/LRE family protein n=1 Tax=Mycobacterium interjectum TaxID=33895 RepID=UPI000A061919|nr:SMP-30/gluconolactonase/LRE family protein [Mycobacterium interjectum]MCV7091102.1 SMP-30/gluconolactonase/LRE family protein [Mycobacterium interjectum]
MSGTGEAPGVTHLHAFGRGVERPEHVVVAGDGRVFASDKASAVAELIDENTVRRMGQAGGEPNGIALDRDGHFLIANWGLGVLQDLDPATGEITAILDGQLDGRPLRWLNFVLVDSVGALWCSVSTTADDLLDTIARGTADGFLFRVAPDRQSAHVVADEVNFPNCMALDCNEDYLYVVRTVAADVVRFPIEGQTLGPPEPFGPPLGDRRPDEFGPDCGRFLGDPQVGRRWGMADGCAFDAEGNLWVTLVLANRIVAISPGDRATTVIEDPDGALLNAPTSIAWGGPDMCDIYIGSIATPYVLKGRSSVPGLPLIHQR